MKDEDWSYLHRVYSVACGQVSSHLIDEDIKWTLEYSGNRSPVCNIYHPHSGELFASRPAIFLLNTSV
jgi:hypothetical protein